MFSPCGECHAQSVRFVEHVRSRVPALLRMCSPTHIPRLVAPAVVDAVQTVFKRRAGADVREECREVVTPARGYFYTPSPVVLKLWGAGVVTPLDCAAPDGVLCSLVHSVGSARISLRAAARDSAPFSEVHSVDGRSVSARAVADPILHTSTRAVRVKNAQPSELEACDVY